jgi:hypothetical protein
VSVRGIVNRYSYSYITLYWVVLEEKELKVVLSNHLGPTARSLLRRPQPIHSKQAIDRVHVSAIVPIRYGSTLTETPTTGAKITRAAQRVSERSCDDCQPRSNTSFGASYLPLQHHALSMIPAKITKTKPTNRLVHPLTSGINASMTPLQFANGVAAMC